MKVRVRLLHRGGQFCSGGRVVYSPEKTLTTTLIMLLNIMYKAKKIKPHPDYIGQGFSSTGSEPMTLFRPYLNMAINKLSSSTLLNIVYRAKKIIRCFRHLRGEPRSDRIMNENVT